MTKDKGKLLTHIVAYCNAHDAAVKVKTPKRLKWRVDFYGNWMFVCYQPRRRRRYRRFDHRMEAVIAIDDYISRNFDIIKSSPYASNLYGLVLGERAVAQVG